MPKKGCVTKRDPKKNAVTSSKVKNESLTGKDIKDGSIGAKDLARGAAIGPTHAFVSSEDHRGGFGVAAWDALCQADAEANKLALGVYRAWLSTSSFDARDMLPPGPFVDPRGKIVASSKADLLDGRILTGINRTASGGIFGVGAWTGTDVDGAFLAPNCADWSDNTPGPQGRFGLSINSDSGWTDFSAESCHNDRFVYCFQVQ